MAVLGELSKPRFTRLESGHRAVQLTLLRGEARGHPVECGSQAAKLGTLVGDPDPSGEIAVAPAVGCAQQGGDRFQDEHPAGDTGGDQGREEAECYQQHAAPLCVGHAREGRLRGQTDHTAKPPSAMATGGT